jgi:phenylalanine-4-hydroxylase
MDTPHDFLGDAVTREQTPAADYTIDQKWDRYTDDEHARWNELYTRQIKIWKGRVVPELYEGLDKLNLDTGGIPDLARLNPKLRALTGWEVVQVPHLVPDEVFFDHLANRRFPAGRFIRTREQMDYIEEPDIFHDVFGHVPLLVNPVFADYMQAYGKGGQRAVKLKRLHNLARLYWYTVEFGLMKTDNGYLNYGAGIISSPTETVFAVEDDSPNRLAFDMERVMLTNYRIDDFQQTYFVINSFEDLFEATQQDFGPIYQRLIDAEKAHAPEAILETDHVYHKGTQAYANSK